MATRASSCDQRRRQHFFACKKFNTEPESGISYMREHGLLSDSGAAGVAEFLHIAEGLKKSVIGKFFGGSASFNQEVLAAFVRRHNFSGQPLLPSLRRLLGGFRLPGESQQIGRVVNCFAQHYCYQNDTEFASIDACAALCNALLLLNTLLHNPNVSEHERPGVEWLMEMARHADQPILSRPRLQQLYNSVKLYEFEVPPEDDADDLALALRQPERSGWLTERRWPTERRCRLLSAPWRRRWFALLQNSLCIFDNQDDASPRGVVPLVNLKMRGVQDRCKSHCFELCGASGPVMISDSESQLRPVSVNSLQLHAENHQDMIEWMLAIAAKTAEQPPPTPLPQPDRRALTHEETGERPTGPGS